MWTKVKKELRYGAEVTAIGLATQFTLNGGKLGSTAILIIVGIGAVFTLFRIL